MAAPSSCPGCGAELDPVKGDLHEHLNASPACLALYGDLLSREFLELDHPPHQGLTPDAYAVQHPSADSRRTRSAIGVHLCRLYLAVEQGVPPADLHAETRWLVTRPPRWSWLEPPVSRGRITVADVLASPLEEHDEAVERWARGAWAAWSEHHGQVRDWIDEVAERRAER